MQVQDHYIIALRYKHILLELKDKEQWIIIVLGYPFIFSL